MLNLILLITHAIGKAQCGNFVKSLSSSIATVISKKIAWDVEKEIKTGGRILIFSTVILCNHVFFMLIFLTLLSWGDDGVGDGRSR